MYVWLSEKERWRKASQEKKITTVVTVLLSTMLDFEQVILQLIVDIGFWMFSLWFVIERFSVIGPVRISFFVLAITSLIDSCDCWHESRFILLAYLSRLVSKMSL